MKLVRSGHAQNQVAAIQHALIDFPGPMSPQI
jgi:hypothetical protein